MSASARSSFGRWAVPLAEISTFVAGFFIVSLLFLRLRPVPPLPRISEKFAYFTRHKDEFDVIFFGSSRIQRGIVPSEFDAAMAAAGQPVRSFNFGLDGMFAPETHLLLDEVLALKPAHLKWVFLELTPVQTHVGEQYRDTARAWFWHDVRRTTWVVDELRSVSASDASRPPGWPWSSFGRQGMTLQQTAEHLRLLALHYGNAGRGRELFADGTPDESVERVGDGWIKARRTAPLDGVELENYQKALDVMRRSPVAQKQGPGFVAAYRYAARSIRAAGAEPVFYTAPTIDAVQDYFPDGSSPTAVLAFNDPQKYGVLYGADARTDGEHANEFGARTYTRLLAARFIAEVAAKASPR